MVKHCKRACALRPRLSNDQYWPGVRVIPPLRFGIASGTCFSEGSRFFRMGNGICKGSGTYICEGSGLFYCMGNGICENGYGFDADFHRYLPLLEPFKTETGKVRVLQPKIEGNVKAKGYWKAQCLFRDLSSTGTLEDLQQRLRSSGELGMHSDVAELEEKLNEEFWKENAVTQKKMWDGLETRQKKLYANAGWFLRETFSQPEVRVLAMRVRQEHYEKQKVQSAAAALDLCHESTYAPRVDDKGERWVVFGRNRSIVTKEIQRVRVETEAETTPIREAEAERTRILHETVVSEATADDAYWDVGGLWAINCPSIESKWGVTRGGVCSLDIRFAQNRRWGHQMWAKFDFIGMEGVFRFRKPQHCPDSDGESSESKCDDEDFYLDFVEWPSPKCSKWEYAWRGKDISSCKALHGKGMLCSLTFGDVGGMKLDGRFESDPTGFIQFTGLKIGESPRSPSAEWEIVNYKWKEQEGES